MNNGAFKTCEERYLDLLKKCLTRSMFGEGFERIPKNTKTLWRRLRYAGYSTINRVLEPWHLSLVHSKRYTGETMIEMDRLNNIEHCLLSVIRDGVPGDVIEAGVWRGGATIFMKAVLDVYGVADRNVWVADSFQGMPKPNPEKYPADRGSRFWTQSLDVAVEEVKNNFRRYGLLDDRVKFLVGFFSDTMPTAPIEKLAVLRIDGNLYESTIEVLNHLYPKLAHGGFVIIDGYGGIPECMQATEDYRSLHDITEPIQFIDWTGVYWQKRAAGLSRLRHF